MRNKLLIKSIRIKFENNSDEFGFTIPELLVVITVMIILLSITTVSLEKTQHKTSLGTTVTTLLTDMREEQTKAMSGDTEGRATVDSYGLYVQQNKYTIFHGTTYNPADTTNYDVNLDPSLQFTTITLPNSSLIFFKGTGEFYNFANGSNTFTLKNTVTNDTKTITINRYGVVTQVN